MQDNATNKRIRDKLLNAEVQAPNFEDLLGKDFLDDVALRSTLSNKLANHSSLAPHFDVLFSNELLGQIPAKNKQTGSSRKLSAWWSIAAVAAACTAVAFFFPNPYKKQAGGSSIYSIAQNQEELYKTKKATSPAGLNIQPIHINVDALNASSLLTEATPSSKEHQAESPQTELFLETSGEDETVNSNVIDSTAKINPSNSKKGLSIAQTQMQKNYALELLLKKKSKKNSRTLSAGINGSNRILSMVNTRDNGGFSLNGVVNKSNGDYEKLEGASTITLRSSTVSPNEWNTVENIDPSMLLDFETNYLLPINLGITISLPLFWDVNLITGIQYSYIANHIKGTNFDLKQEQHYLGIPVKFSLNFIQSKKFIAYALAGATIEKGLAGVQTSEVEGDETWRGRQGIKGLAISLCGGVGASYDLKKNVLLYLEPGISWYAPTDQPVCIRTEEPFQFNVSLGLRYRFQ
jgi:hypothetical protein